MSASESRVDAEPDFVAVAVLADVPPGRVTAAEVDGYRIALVNDGGEIHAIDQDCSHAGGPLGEGRTAGCLVACPWHGAVFDARTGEPARGPARKSLRTHPVELDGETILVAVDDPRSPAAAEHDQSDARCVQPPPHAGRGAEPQRPESREADRQAAGHREESS